MTRSRAGRRRSTRITPRGSNKGGGGRPGRGRGRARPGISTGRRRPPEGVQASQQLRLGPRAGMLPLAPSAPQGAMPGRAAWGTTTPLPPSPASAPDGTAPPGEQLSSQRGLSTPHPRPWAPQGRGHTSPFEAPSPALGACQAHNTVVTAWAALQNTSREASRPSSWTRVRTSQVPSAHVTSLPSAVV